MNIDPTVFSPTIFSVASLGTVGAVFAGAVLGLHLKNWVPGLGLRDSLRAVVYVTQYDIALEYHGLRRRENRARVDELRADLAESAVDGGALAAIGRLGPPRVLAAEVAGTRMVPSWSRGIYWLVVALVIGLVAFQLSASAFLSAVESGVPPGVTASWSSAFWTMSATSEQGGPSSLAVDFRLVALTILVVPFGLGSRVWRLWSLRSE